MREWPGDPTVAHLIFLDHQTVPSCEHVDAALDHARRRGARAIRTSALFPDAAAVVLGAGFHEIDRLALLRFDLTDVRERPAVAVPVRPMRPWHLARAAACDRDAFGPLWGNDESSLRDITRATPRHHARIVADRRSVAAFAISGAAGEIGYLQRLAVGHAHRRQGLATDLVVESLRWMHELSLGTCLVNTGVANQPALRLYERIGFQPLADELVIAERSTGP
jgi:ribosomal protein S18 acetylase RimI-like enzyme